MIENPFSDDEMDGDDFEGFESEDDSKVEAQAPPKKRKENPYVPPVANGSTRKREWIRWEQILSQPVYQEGYYGGLICPPPPHTHGSRASEGV